ncbi:MAG: thioredoxin domain-containing protein [Candidatus Burarchaeum sp.]|nr:thioredoxin domain-containing protein [Candidatus Burarchaeum sp.]MDO8339784.1 thioredoxin domain-containing protein [Candidatus Burarchaeum sp.]
MDESEPRGEAQKAKRQTPGTVDIPMPVLILIALVAGLILGYLAAGILQPKAAVPAGGAAAPVETGLSLDQVKAKVSGYMDKLLAAQPAGTGLAIDVKSASKDKGMYSVLMDLKQNGTTVQQMDALVSPDGTTLFLYNAAYGIYVSYDLTKDVPKAPAQQTQQQAQPAAQVVKTEKPKVEMFVMSFCPYGQQAENGIGPVANLLGEKISIEPHFILGPTPYYGDVASDCITTGTGTNICSLHGVKEVQEDERQICILKYAPEKWWDYAFYVDSKCSLDTIDSCWHDAAKATGVDEAVVEKCFADEAPGLLAAEMALSSSKGVSGSPTIFVNGVNYNGGRSAENFKSAFCDAFTTAPDECGQTISSTPTAPSGSCGPTG